MIDELHPEPGGETAGVHRITISLPVSEPELRKLRDLIEEAGFSPDLEQIDAYLAGEDWTQV